MKKYDYLIVGAGLYGAVFAHEAASKGKTVLVLEKRSHIGGNVYTEKVEGISVHKYGAHIFHTNNREVWDYVNRFAAFNRYTNSPVANYKGDLYSLPFNMYTFNKMWGVVTPEQAEEKIAEQKQEIQGEPKNLEEQAIALVGRDIYEKLVKGYMENLLEGIEVRLDTDYLAEKETYDAMAEQVIYTGPVDAYFGYSLGTLEYRSVRFEQEIMDISNYQGNAVVNYTDRETPWTRIIEHKWFEFGKDENGKELPKTVISREYSSEWKPGDEPYYPVNDEKNNGLYEQYRQMADREEKVCFGGRLGEYKYYDMDAVILSALTRAREML